MQNLSESGVSSVPPNNQKHDAKSTYHRGAMQIVLVVGFVVIGLITNKFLSSTGEHVQQVVSGNDYLPVTLTKPTVKDSPVFVTEGGFVQVRNKIELVPQLSGRVIETSPNLASGGFFKAGEVLFRLDDADYVTALERAIADVSSAQASLLLEQTEAEIAKSEWQLVHPNETMPPLVGRAAQIAKAEAAVEVAKAAEAQARINLSRVEYSLPFDGRILSTTVEAGQYLGAGKTYGLAYNAKHIEVSVPIDTQTLEILSPSVGRNANIIARSQSAVQRNTYTARLIREDAELDAKTKLSRLVLAINESHSLVPGEFVQVTINGPTMNNAHFVPDNSVAENNTIWIVKNGMIKARQPRIYFAQNGHVITEAFDIGEGIVVSPPNNLSVDTQVQVIETSKTGRVQ